MWLRVIFGSIPSVCVTVFNLEKFPKLVPSHTYKSKFEITKGRLATPLIYSLFLREAIL